MGGNCRRTEKCGYIDARTGLLYNVHAFADKMNELEIVNVVSALGKMNISLESEIDTRNILLVNLERVLDSMNSEAVSRVLLGLGKSMRLEHLPSGFKEGLFRRLSKVQLANPRQTASALMGLKRIGFRWDSLDNSTRRELEKSIECIWNGGENAYYSGALSETIGQRSKDKRTVEQSLANIVWSLGSMDVYWEDLSIEAREALMLSIGNVAPILKVQGLSNVLFGLAKMKCSSDSLSRQCIMGLLSSFRRLGPSLGPQALSNCIWALGEMGTEWEATMSKTPVVDQRSMDDGLVEVITLPRDVQLIFLKSIEKTSNSMSTRVYQIFSVV